MLYRLLKNIAAICFNALNILLRGNLPPFACVCVIVKNNGSYLVIEQSADQYVFPGGFMRWHEQPSETAQRETREETGLELHIDSFSGYQLYNSHACNQISTLTLIYTAHISGGSLRASSEGRPRWLPEQAIADKLAPIAHELFTIYIAHQKQHSLAEDACSNS